MALINSKKPPDGDDDEDGDEEGDEDDGDDEDHGWTDAQSDLLDPAANFNPGAVAVAVAKVPLMNKHKYVRPLLGNHLLPLSLSLSLFHSFTLFTSVSAAFACLSFSLSSR